MIGASPFANFKSMFAVALLLIVSPLALRASTRDDGPTAANIIAKAEAQARAEHKRILLDFSASWCGNCRLFERFLADPEMKPILSRSFVFATIITGERKGDAKHGNTPGGEEFENAIGGKGQGFPWLAILDAGGKPISNSDRPDTNATDGRSNIGYPDSPEEIDWFLEMLRRASLQMSEPDLVSVHAWLTAHDSTHSHA